MSGDDTRDDDTQELLLGWDGTELDPVDGQPVFTELDGEQMSRRRWLEATKEEREEAQGEAMAALVEKFTVRRSGEQPVESEPKPKRTSKRIKKEN